MARPARKPLRRFRIEALEARRMLAADLVISEFMALNTSGLADQDGAHSDWIEIHNQSSAAINLAGWHLTDEADALTKWTFPAVSLAADGYLVVFASGKDRATAGSELHTNFQLNVDGEYLGLIAPDGFSPASQFVPAFAPQHADVSYGAASVVSAAPLLTAGAVGKVLVPSADIGDGWTASNFDDLAWTSAVTGVGFDTTAAAGILPAYTNAGGSVGTQSYTGSMGQDFVVNQPITITHLGVFDSGSNGLNRTLTSQLWVRNTTVTPNTGTKLAELEFSPADPGTLVNGNRFKPLGTSIVLQPGAYSIVAYGYGGSAAAPATYEPNGNEATGGPLAASKSTNSGGGALTFGNTRFASTSGAFPTTTTSISSFYFSAATFQFSPSVYADLIGTNLQQAMVGVNPSAYMRVPFNVASLAGATALTLKMKYDDGYVAYLNGVEIARSANVPVTPTWNSTASSEHPNGQGAVFESIDITSHLGLLHAGTNVLAIQGLNASAANGDFLILPALDITSVDNSQLRFFLTPTPGAVNNSGVIDFVGDVQFSLPHGMYDAAIDVTLGTATSGAQIRYTLNGSAPTATTGSVYSGAIHITSTTTLRAAAFKTGYNPTPVATQTYLFLSNVLTQTGAGFPASWNGTTPDYAVDPDVVNNPAYASEILDDLKAIPSLSIVMDMADLFGPNGIYSNPTQEGDAWERPTSAELIYADGREGFSENAGIQIFGSGWRDPSAASKHALRLVFKSEYGATKLNYPLFSDTDVESFNTLVLRAQGSRGWNDFRESINGTQYIHDSWFRDTELALGNPTTHATYVHLYLNGLYWGLYNPVERPDAAYAAEHFGGDETQYDALDARVGVIKVIDGDQAAWNTVMALADAGLSTPVAYNNIKQYVDVQNLINYVLVNVYAGNQDWVGTNGNNMRVVRKREAGAGFKFFSWDAEYSFWNAGDNSLGLNTSYNTPAKLFMRLLDNAEFRILFADTVHRELFNSGALTPENAAARWSARAAEIYGAVVGESARWGDYRREPPYTRDVEWQAELDRLLTSYFPQRTDALLSQMRAATWYPNLAAPEFNQNGGAIPTGFRLSMSPSTGAIYYTLDGSDPRLPGGAIAPGAIFYNPTYSTLIGAGAPGRVLVPTSGVLGGAWTNRVFDDSSWTSGPSNIGFDTGGTASLVNIANQGVATQSTQYDANAFPASAALDANTGSFTHTQDAVNSFWNLEFPSSRTISKIVLKNRADCCPERLSNFRVSVFNDAQVEVFGQNFYTPAQGGGNPSFGASVNIDLPAGIAGRQVRVQLLGQNNAGNGYLSLAEVEVYAPQTFDSLIGQNLQSSMLGVNASAYLRVPFNVADVQSIDTLALRMKYDDGFVAYLNGQEVARRNAPAAVAWDSTATADHPKASSATAEEINLSAFLGLLVAGENVLSIQGLNDSSVGGDFLLVPELIGGSNSAIPLNASSQVKARALSGAVWSALSDATFLTPAVPPLRITEIMYHPANAPPGSPYADSAFEFVELQNVGAQPLGIGGTQLSGGIDFVFPAQTLAPGQFVLVVSDLVAFETRYGAGLNVAGQYLNKLDNSSEPITLTGPLGEPILDFSYSDTWQPTTDGAGPSLVIVDAGLPITAWGTATSWRASHSPLGSPGLTDPLAAVAARQVFYNNSKFDGNNPAAGSADDAAIAAGKVALLPGQVATAANYTNYSRGINGVMIDIAGLQSTPTISDFAFRMGNDDATSGWAIAAAPTSIVVRPGAGAGGSSRVELVWADGAVKNTWLEITVKATTVTGLAQADVFYFGNAVGESGDSPAHALVNSTDETSVRNNSRTFVNPALVDSPHDFNRDGFVNATDQILARSNATTLATALKLISPPAAASVLHPQIPSVVAEQSGLSAVWLSNVVTTDAADTVVAEVAGEPQPPQFVSPRQRAPGQEVVSGANTQAARERRVAVADVSFDDDLIELIAADLLARL